MNNIFGEEVTKEIVHVNVYADEIQNKQCLLSGHKWHYIGLIIEKVGSTILDDIIKARFIGNFDQNSPYYARNNRLVHWSEINSADSMNICSRWFDYVLSPELSKRTFYSYIFGINNSLLNRGEFDLEDEFNSKYNRFFYTAMMFSLRTFFPSNPVIIDNIYHEAGQQQDSALFAWHSLRKIQKANTNIIPGCETITFLPKDHKLDPRSNLIQLCDTVMGVSTDIIHGMGEGKAFDYKKQLMAQFYPLVQRLTVSPNNLNSSYQYYKRIMIDFFPKSKSELGSLERYKNQFYTNRPLHFATQISGQQSFNI